MLRCMLNEGVNASAQGAPGVPPLRFVPLSGQPQGGFFPNKGFRFEGGTTPRINLVKGKVDCRTGGTPTIPVGCHCGGTDTPYFRPLWRTCSSAAARTCGESRPPPQHVYTLQTAMHEALFVLLCFGTLIDTFWTAVVAPVSSIVCPHGGALCQRAGRM